MSGTHKPKVHGVIPAAGQSIRMGCPKQLLSFRGSTILETVIETMLAGGLDGFVVIAHPQIDEQLNLADDPRYATAILDDPGAEMIDSILLGVATLADLHKPTADDAFLVCPGDMPTMPVDLIAACAADYRENPQQIVVGAIGEKASHPIVIPFSLQGEIEQLRGVGLKAILAIHADRVRRVQVPSPDKMTDIDTPEDYQASQG